MIKTTETKVQLTTSEITLEIKQIERGRVAAEIEEIATVADTIKARAATIISKMEQETAAIEVEIQIDKTTVATTIEAEARTEAIAKAIAETTIEIATADETAV